ncbi:MAG TPA: FlgD immunoglobulin-like domain containing protein, partial [Prolixibacteraceae bacterium]
SGTNIIAGTNYGGEYLSTNNGASWTQPTNGLSTNLYVSTFIVDGTNVYAGTAVGVFLSTTNGEIWSQITNSMDSIEYVSSLAISGNNIFAGSAGDYPYTYGKGIFLSTNNGKNWTQVNNGLLLYNRVWSLTISENSIFAGLDNGVYRSTNNGTNWTDVSDGLTNTSINVLTVLGTNIFAGTNGSGVWVRPLSELTGVSNEVKTLPQEYTLFQNYPNPFNPSTVIKYAVPFESSVDIRVYNSLGQTVREINDGNRQPGSYEYNFNSSSAGGGLASGIYFYSLKAISTNGKKDFSAVKKMILLK